MSFYDFFIIDLLVYYLLQIDLWLRFKPRHFYHSLCNFILQLLGCCFFFFFSFPILFSIGVMFWLCKISYKYTFSFKIIVCVHYLYFLL